MNTSIARVFLAIFVSALLLILALDLARVGYVHIGDIAVYYGEAASIFHGHAPYAGTPIEYPPGVLPFMLLPYLLINLTNSYFSAYIMLTLLAMAVLLWHRMSRDGQDKWWLFLLPLIPLLQFVYMQLDIFAALFLYFGVFYFQKQKYILAAALIALATIIKAYPAVCLLPLFWMVPVRLRPKFVACFVLVIGACLLPVLLLAPHGFYEAVVYQSNRPIETLASGAVIGYILNLAGSHVRIIVSHKSFALLFSKEKIVDWISTALLVAGLLGLSAKTALKRLKNLPALLSIVALLIFVLLYNIGSSQFLVPTIFLLPLVKREISANQFKRLIILMTISSMIVWLQFLSKFGVPNAVALSGVWAPISLLLSSLRIAMLLITIIFCLRLAQDELKPTKKLSYNNAHG